jgi:DNA-binding response OmpR family regulator
VSDTATSPSRILVVDDDHGIQDVTRTVLGSAGYDVQAVSSGREALDLAGEERFDLILLDINMPGMDGWETLRLLRADDALDDVPVVMFSIKGEVQDKVLGLQEGASDYITKPFVVDALLERVGRVLQEGRRPASGDGAGVAEETS